MKNPFLRKTTLILLMFLLAGCSAANKGTNMAPTLTSIPLPTAEVTVTIAETPTSELTATPVFSPAAIYSDNTNGFVLDYPADWTLIPNTQIGSRGSQAQLFSPGTTTESLLAGGTRVTITVFDWDPKNDLNAYAAQRKTAFLSSGSKITQEVTGAFADGRAETHFILESAENQQTYVMLTTVGERYLQLAGEGDLKLVDEIAQTLRNP